ncbi:MAG: pyridoxamine 5'-phosphate oxidase family protein [Actinomycetota bacterium]
MPDRQPTDVTNLDRYGNPVLPWSRPRDLLAHGPKGPGVGFFLGTVRPEGRPHAAGVGAVWHDGDLYFSSGPGTRKARNLAANPACTISAQLAGMDLTLDGTAARETDPAVLEQVASIYREIGWPAEVAGDAFTAPYSAPTAGPPPWHLYRFTFHTVIGLATDDTQPSGATRWRFG